MSHLPPNDCRAFLAAALAAGGAPEGDGHAEQCRACADRLALHQRLVPFLKSRPVAPAALHAPASLSAIHERVIDASESSPLGTIVAGAMNIAPASAAWPEELLQSPLAERTVVAPPAQSPLVWARVRQAILAEARATPAARRRPWLLGAAGLAAAAVVTVLLLLPEGAASRTNIVFVDFPVMPQIDSTLAPYWVVR